MAKARLKCRDVYIDFAIRKPHTILIGSARKPTLLDDLGKLGLEHCRIFIEEGCPGQKLYQLMQNNRIFAISGKFVKTFRERDGLIKSDLNDAYAIRALARHDPDSFREMTSREKEELTDQMMYAYYCRVTSLIVCLKTYQWWFAGEFGRELPELEATLKNLEREKERTLTYFGKFKEGVRKSEIKGLCIRYLGGILIKAHPSRFRSLSAYLGYCGLKRSARESGRYSRHVLSLYHQLSSSTIMHKDGTFYPLYLKVKTDLRSRFPNYPKHKIDGMAKNRVSTFLAKRIYASFKPDKTHPLVPVAKVAAA